jgi:hypothetical protein
MKIAFGLIAAALALSGCNPPDPPQPTTPCGNAAQLVDNPYATPEAREMGLEFLRARCFGRAANGSPPSEL